MSNRFTAARNRTFGSWLGVLGGLAGALLVAACGGDSKPELFESGSEPGDSNGGEDSRNGGGNGDGTGDGTGGGNGAVNPFGAGGAAAPPSPPCPPPATSPNGYKQSPKQY